MARNSDLSGGGVYGDCWKIPGGGVDPGETLQQALTREVREETGIDISTIPITLVDDSMTGEAEKNLRDTGERVLAKMKFYTYRATLNIPSVEVRVILDPHEFNEYRWVQISELKQLKLSPPSLALFGELGYI